MANKQITTHPLNYFVGWVKNENTNDYILYTAFPQAVHVLARRGIEFYYSPKDECMTATVKKVPADFGDSSLGRVVFYEEFAVNKPVTKQTRQALARDCAALKELDLARNKAYEEWITKKDSFERKEQGIKHRIFVKLQQNGAIVKRGRWYHRAVLIETFRVFCKTIFARPTLVLDLRKLRGLAKKFKKFKAPLESTIRLESVEINPELYEKKIKNCLTPAERKKHCYEHYEVSEEALEALVPKLPYDLQRRLWEFDSPIDDEGIPYYTIHPQTHTSKNPECLECGGKFRKGSNECRDCGLESFVDEKVKAIKKDKKAKGRKPRLKVVSDDDITYKPSSSTRKRPAPGESRY